MVDHLRISVEFSVLYKGNIIIIYYNFTEMLRTILQHILLQNSYRIHYTKYVAISNYLWTLTPGYLIRDNIKRISKLFIREKSITFLFCSHKNTVCGVKRYDSDSI